MAGVYVQSRLEFLVRSQNADGGWGYFPGKQSWLEPTAYAALALIGAAGSEAVVGRAWDRVMSWRMGDGGWRPGGAVDQSTWVTALVLLLGTALGADSKLLSGAAGWLLAVSGQESRLLSRLFSYFHLLQTEVNVQHRGWPWAVGNSSWIEPTALTVLALKKCGDKVAGPGARARIVDGEELILSRRGRDGGWNCGNPNVLKYDLPSYPESTAIALVGLQGRVAPELAGAVGVAAAYYGGCKSPLAKAWLAIALRSHGQAPVDGVGAEVPRDVLVCALETLGHAEGNSRFLRWGKA